MTADRPAPFSIDTLPLPDGSGVIGMSYCPGRCEPHARAGHWRRELVPDLEAVRAWRAQALVSLLEEHEFDLLNVRRLGEHAEALGLDWHHLPIPDLDVPGWEFERLWLYAGLRLRRLLRQGGRVVVHCRAGLGRTGTIAARLLVELGVPAAEAISLVRRTRPGTIQTPAQEAHVQAVRPIREGRDRANAQRLGCLVGGALGDAFGYAPQVDKVNVIQRRPSPEELREPRLHRGRLLVSAATQLTLFTLEGLTRAMRAGTTGEAGLVDAVRRSYLDWLETQGRIASGGGQATRLMKHAALHARRDPGRTCIKALAAGGAGTPERPLNASSGRGGVMRVAPVGLMPGLAPRHAFNLGARLAALTHGHPDAYIPAGILAATVAAMIEGTALPEAVLAARDLARHWPGHETCATRVDAALAAAIRPHPGALPLALGTGWEGDEALAIGLYAAARSRQFREVAALAADHDGPAAATASLAGQLFGARHGIDALPHAWVRRLDALAALCDLADWAQPVWVKK